MWNLSLVWFCAACGDDDRPASAVTVIAKNRDPSQPTQPSFGRDRGVRPLGQSRTTSFSVGVAESCPMLAGS